MNASAQEIAEKVKKFEKAVRDDAEGKDVTSPNCYPMSLRNENRVKAARSSLLSAITAAVAELQRKLDLCEKANTGHFLDAVDIARSYSTAFEALVKINKCGDSTEHKIAREALDDLSGGAESRRAKRLVCPPDTDQPEGASSNDEFGAGERNTHVFASAEETHNESSASPAQNPSVAAAVAQPNDEVRAYADFVEAYANGIVIHPSGRTNLQEAKYIMSRRKEGEKCSLANAETPLTASTDNTEAHSNAAPIVQSDVATAEVAQADKEKKKDIGPKTLDAKWLDPECWDGCQSLVYKRRITEALELKEPAAENAKKCWCSPGVRVLACPIHGDVNEWHDL